jgi:predicted YcjX-like family ATPase
MMLELPSEHTWLYKSFQEQGFHTVRRSSRVWAGLDRFNYRTGIDALNQSRGGLTRGRGVTESARLQWAYSMHKCAGVHNAMTTLTDRKHDITDEEHKE